MEKFLVVYTLLGLIALALIVLYASRGDASSRSRWAKIRVRVNDHDRRRLPESTKDEWENQVALSWLILGAAILLLFILSAGKI